MKVKKSFFGLCPIMLVFLSQFCKAMKSQTPFCLTFHHEYHFFCSFFFLVSGIVFNLCFFLSIPQILSALSQNLAVTGKQFVSLLM